VATAEAAASGTPMGVVNGAYAGAQTQAGGVSNPRVSSGVTREALARSLEAGVANSAGKSGRHN